MTLVSKLEARLDWDWRDGAIDSDSLRVGRTLEDGDGVFQADAAWHDIDASLGSGGSRTLDLQALTRNVLGQTLSVSFDTIRAILIEVAADSTGTLVVGDAASDTWFAPFGSATDTIAVGPGSPLLITALETGWPVGTSAKNFKLTASGGSITYSIAIIGTV